MVGLVSQRPGRLRYLLVAAGILGHRAGAAPWSTARRGGSGAAGSDHRRRGWSALIVAALDLSLNPLSTVLAVLVTAIATEFG